MASADADPARDAARRAESALDAVHAALLAGHLADLAPLVAEIAEAVDAIGGLDDMELAMTLQRKARRNEACLQAAARGVRAATRRIRDLMAIAQGLQTYDGQGRRASLGSGAGQLVRRL